MNVALRVKQLREAKNLSQNKLAILSGLSQGMIRQIELGKKNPTVDSVSKICSALDITLAEFFADTETNLYGIATKIKNLTDKTGEASAEFINKLREPGVMEYIVQNEIPKLREIYVQTYGEDSATVKMDNLRAKPIEEQINFILQFGEGIKENPDGSFTLIARGSKDADVRRLMEDYNSLSESDRQIVLLLIDRLKRSPG